MYNYKKFANKEYDLTHSTGIQVGDTLSNFTFLNLNGEQKSIENYFNKPIVLETGSITCGMFAGQSERMNALAKENPDFYFLLLYVREAHPGKLINAHATIEEKCTLANRLKTEDAIKNRTIIIDDIKGTLHQILGALPNMVFIIDTNGKVVFKEDWNNAQSLKNAIQTYKTTHKTLQQKWEMLPLPNIPIEFRIFKRAGWDAGLDFLFALPKLIFSHLLQPFCLKYPKYC